MPNPTKERQKVEQTTDRERALVEAASLYGPDGYFAKFVQMASTVKDAAAKIKADEERRSAAYKHGYADGVRAALSQYEEPKV